MRTIVKHQDKRKAKRNVFAELTNTVEHCSLGQITNRLTEVVGKFRPMV